MSRSLAAAFVVLSMLAAATPGEAEPTEGFHVVRFAGPITDAARAAVEGTGLEVIDVEPPDGYLVWGTIQARAAAADLAVVTSADPLPRSRKQGSLEPSPYVEITAHAAAVPELLDVLGPHAEVFPSRADGVLVTIATPLERVSAADLTAHPAVLHVNASSPVIVPDDEGADQIVAGNVDRDGLPVPGYRAWLEEIGLDGEGIRVAVTDTGVSERHPDLAGRVERPVNYTGNPALDVDGHGTHVAGIIAGSSPPGTALGDVDGLLHGLGVAPDATLVDLRLNGPFGRRPPGGFAQLSGDAWRAGTRMWNASWHTVEGERAGYTASTRLMDELSRNADLEAPGAEEFLMVFSAGNAGDAGPTTPHAAKNVISVGSLNYRLSAIKGSAETVNGGSSKGPTKDGRIFPSLAAPGALTISSARAPEATNPGCFPVATGPVLYAGCGGTSMAAPHVTGAAALVHQWWDGIPSPAMVKALLVNSATDIGEPDIPNHTEGWGRVDIGTLFESPPTLAVDRTRVFGGPGEDAVYEVEVGPGEALGVTLAWSDAPAAVGASPALVNDLDLLVEHLGTDGEVVGRWLGNVFASGASAAGGSPDRLNNVERVLLLDPAAGRYRITVAAASVPGDGIPENTDTTDQDFALVVGTG